MNKLGISISQNIPPEKKRIVTVFTCLLSVEQPKRSNHGRPWVVHCCVGEISVDTNPKVIEHLGLVHRISKTWAPASVPTAATVLPWTAVHEPIRHHGIRSVPSIDNFPSPLRYMIEHGAGLRNRCPAAFQLHLPNAARG